MGKLCCIFEEGATGADDGGSSRAVNVCRCEQGEVVESSNVVMFRTWS